MRKVKLWNYSMWLNSCVLALAVVNLIFVFTIEYYNIGDALMDITIACGIMIHFWQWRENVHVFLDRKFLQPLRVKHGQERQIF
jgi:hypothetical protein